MKYYDNKNYNLHSSELSEHISYYINYSMYIDMKIQNTWFNKSKKKRLIKHNKIIKKHVYLLINKKYNNIVSINEIDRIFGKRTFRMLYLTTRLK